MTHKMRLVDFAFESIKNREKDIELRLNDEKRRLINIGDIIIFSNIDTGEELTVQVKDLYKEKNFDILFDKFDHERFGLKNEDDASIMDIFYTKEEIEKYGALGILIDLI